MNGYKMYANTLRQVIEKEGPDEELEHKIQIYDMLAEFKPEDKYTVFDTGMFNDILKGYVQKIIVELCDDDDEEKSQAAINLMAPVNAKTMELLDLVSSKEAEKFYNNN